MPPTIAPYGTWTSPILPQSLAADTHPVTAAIALGDSVWWSEQRPSEHGRAAILSRESDGTVIERLTAPASARSRVHEYGGLSWTVAAGEAEPLLVWVEASDQRLWLQSPDSDRTPLTPAELGMQFAEPSIVTVGDERHILAVRETIPVGFHGTPPRDIVLVPLDGAAAEDPERIRVLASGTDFLAWPRISPDGQRLAWIGWDHPQMPWDGTWLMVGNLTDDGPVQQVRRLIGSPSESVLQPEWLDDDTLLAISDRSGWWNPMRVSVPTTLEETPRVDAVVQEDAEYGGPLWQLGVRWVVPVPGEASGASPDLIAVRNADGVDRLVRITTTGEVRAFDLGLDAIQLQHASAEAVLLIGETSDAMPGLYRLELATGELDLLRANLEALPDPRSLPPIESHTVAGPLGPVHVLLSLPRNPDFVAPDGEQPPCVFLVHGGPTGQASARLSLATALLTSRGIAVAEVNYSGSTGFGRAYRERLNEQWGIADVQDTMAAARALAEQGLVDPDRLIIRGGSAGGLTVLGALAEGGVFAGGISRYGVADLLGLVADTHDFEAHYLDTLIGPLPETRQRYIDRSPLHRLERLRSPMLIEQGLLDKVVPPSQSEAVRAALQSAGVPHAYIEFPTEAHGFRTAEAIIRSAEVELAFIAAVCGFEAPGIPALDLQPPLER